MVDFFYDCLFSDAVQTGQVAAPAWLVAAKTARAALHVDAQDVLLLLAPARKAGIRVGGTPDRYYGGGRQRGEMHGGGVHTFSYDLQYIYNALRNLWKNQQEEDNTTGIRPVTMQ